MKYPQLYIHIGLHKTGTSSIQEFLSVNSEVLQRRKIIYPHTEKKNNAHYSLAWSLNEKKKKQTELSPRLIWETMEKEFYDKEFDKIIISSEAFSHLSEIEIKNFYQLVHQYRPKIILYLRRQDHLIQSVYSQRIKQPKNNFSMTINEFLLNIDYPLNFQGFIESWENYFGIKNLLIRVYEKEQLKNGLINDFLGCLEINDVNNEYSLPAGKNISIERTAIEILRLSSLIQIEEKERRLLKRQLLNYFMQSKSKPIYNVHNLISPADRLKLINEYEKSNRYVAKEYFKRDILFYEKYPMPNESWQPLTISPDDISKIINDLKSISPKRKKELVVLFDSLDYSN